MHALCYLRSYLLHAHKQIWTDTLHNEPTPTNFALQYQGNITYTIFVKLSVTNNKNIISITQ